MSVEDQGCVHVVITPSKRDDGLGEHSLVAVSTIT
jgi:hypothetical protein